jgi:transposase-like protein
MSGLRGSTNYSLNLKLKVLDEYREGRLTKTELSKKYGISGHSTILKWLRNFENNKAVLDTNDQSKRIKELEQLLAYEKLRRLAAEETIKVAEEELKISIRKKSVSKQSKK